MNRYQLFVVARGEMITALLGGERFSIRQMTQHLNYRLDFLVSEAQVRRIAHTLPSECVVRVGNHIILKSSDWATFEDIQDAMEVVLKILIVSEDYPLLWDRVEPYLTRILVIGKCALWESVQFYKPSLGWQWMSTGYGLMLRGVA